MHENLALGHGDTLPHEGVLVFAYGRSASRELIQARLGLGERVRAARGWCRRGCHILLGKFSLQFSHKIVVISRPEFISGIFEVRQLLNTIVAALGSRHYGIESGLIDVDRGLVLGPGPLALERRALGRFEIVVSITIDYSSGIRICEI